MQSEELLSLTASEPLTLDEEYAMQRSWREDPDKCTFIVLLLACGGAEVDARCLESDGASNVDTSNDEESTRKLLDVCDVSDGAHSAIDGTLMASVGVDTVGVARDADDTVVHDNCDADPIAPLQRAGVPGSASGSGLDGTAACASAAQMVSGGVSASAAEEAQMVGDVNLFINDPHDPSAAEIDVMIAEAWARGRGVGRQAVLLMLHYGVTR
jgi:hypothetical protein